MQKNRKNVLWITQTAVFIALLIAFQHFTQPFGQYVTGSLVNLVLILAVMLGGVISGVTVAILSPGFAFLLSIGPALLPIVPAIMLGNVTIVLIWHFIAGKKADPIRSATAVVVGALAKFLVLYLLIVQFIIPHLLSLPAKQAEVLGVAFSYPQIITAAIGGILAASALPALKKAIKR